MRVLIVHRYFYPDSPTYAFLLYKLAKSYIGYFSEVSVLTSMPSYYGSSRLTNTPRKEFLDGIRVRRLRPLPENNRALFLRTLNSILFAWSVFWHLVFKCKRYDVVQVATTPPILSALAVTLASKISDFHFVYHCQDIYPDITRINSGSAGRSIVFKLLWKVDRYIMHQARKIIVLSEDMKSHVIDTRRINKEKIEVINNFDFSRPGDGSKNSIPDHLRGVLEDGKQKVIFAGNLGYFQNLDLVFRVMSRIAETREVTFIVIGDGVKRRELEVKYRNNEHIVFTGYLPNSIIQKVYRYCHVGIAPVVGGIEKVAYPSKIISYLMAGLPVITFSSDNSAIGRFITENGLGENYAFGDEKQLETVLLKVLSRSYDRNRINEMVRQEFGENTAYSKWKNVYQSL